MPLEDIYLFRGDAQQSNPLDFFFVFAFLFMIIGMLSVVGHICTRLGRKGFKMDLSVKLSLILILAGCVAGAFTGFGFFGHGKTFIPKWLAVLLFTLPFALVCLVYVMILLLMAFLTRASLNKLVMRHILHRKIRSLQALVSCFLLLLCAAISVLAELYTEPQYFIWIFSLGFIFTSIAIMVGLVAGVDSKRINSDRLSNLKTWIVTVNSIWILVLVAHIIFYQINWFGNIWIWIALFGADFLYLFVSLSYLGYICYDHAYTPSGIDIIKPNFMVELSKERRKSIGKFALEPYTDSSNSKPMFTDEEVKLSLANHMIIWKKIPSSWAQAFSFPHPVNEVDSSLHAFFTCLHIIIIFVTTYLFGWFWWWIVLMSGMLLRFACGPLIDPQAWFVVSVATRMFKPTYVAGPPKRLSQLLGFTVSATSFILYMCGQIEASYGLLAGLFVLAFLQMAYRLCGACFIFYVLMMLGVLPEPLCNQCKIKFKTKKEDTGSQGKTLREPTARSQVTSNTSDNTTPGADVNNN